MKEADSRIDTSPFTIRKPHIPDWAYGAIWIVVMGIAVFMINAGSALLQYALGALLATVFAGVIYLTQHRVFDDKTATEFQALVFSGAMRSSTIFNVILYEDGSIFYLDPRYVKSFDSATPNHNLEQFLTTIGVPNADKVKVYDALKALERLEFDYTYQTDGETSAISVALYPLQRPQGFVNLSVARVKRH